MKTRVLLVATALIAVGLAKATAQTNDESRVAKLEETVRVLEQRVLALEDQLRAVAAPTEIAPTKANWRKLRNRMSSSYSVVLRRLITMGTLLFGITVTRPEGKCNLISRTLLKVGMSREAPRRCLTRRCSVRRLSLRRLQVGRAASTGCSQQAARRLRAAADRER